MLEHTDIGKLLNKVGEVKPQSLKEEILLLDCYVLRYDLVTEIRQLQVLWEKILKLIHKILPTEDVEEWIISLFREDPTAAIILNHALISILKIEEVSYLKNLPNILFNYVWQNAPLSEGSSTILYQAFEKTKEEQYQRQLLENAENVTGIEKIKCLAACYLLTRKEEYLTQAYELVIPIENLSKGDTLDYYIWEVSDYMAENYPETPEFRNHIASKIEEILENEDFDLETLHLVLTAIPGELKIWGKEIFNGFIPTIDAYLNILIDNETGAAIIGRSKGLYKKIGLTGTLKIGKISEKPPHGIGHFARELLLDCTQPHVIFISGHRGSGKSYTMGVIAEELAMAKIGIGVIIIDPLGVYWSMKYPNWEDKELKLLKKWNLESKSFAENVRVFVPLGKFNLTPKETKDEPFSIRPSELSVDDWCYTFKINRFSPRGILIEKAIKLVQEGYEAEVEDKTLKIKGKGNNYSIEDIIRCINHSTMINDKEKGFTRQTRRAMVSRFEIAKEWGIFSIEGTPLIELSKPDQLTIIDVSMIDENLHALIAGILARKILRARLHASRHIEAAKISVDEAEAIEGIPITWLLIDEAHLLVPSRGSTAASEPLVQYAKLGRKPGCGLVLCTQQPSATNTQILSQLDISICHNLTYNQDVDAFTHRAPGDIPKELDTSFFRSLPVGVCVIADESITTSRIFIARIRPRISQHAGREALPTLVDQMDKPVFLQPPITEEAQDETLSTTVEEETVPTEEILDESTYIKLPPSELPSETPPTETISTESDIQETPTIEIPEVPPSPPPIFQINLPEPQLKDYMKRLLLYKYRKHLYPVGTPQLFEKIVFHTVSKNPSMILYQIQDFLLKKGWIIDKVISDSDLPVLLISKNDFRVGISLATLIDSTDTIIIYVGTTPKNSDVTKLEELFKDLNSKMR
ncbi:MAG: ATP-binding protein [Candidatus Helarchaeota archaeon]